MEKECQNCKYWVKNPDNSMVSLGECINPKWTYDYDYRENDIPLDGIWVENNEGWGCFTGPEFGCIQFIQRTGGVLMKYKLIWDCSPIDLEHRVNLYLKEGWALYGNPFAIYDGGRYGNNPNVEYLQAVVREGSGDED
jgi:hypothetical protein